MFPIGRYKTFHWLLTAIGCLFFFIADAQHQSLNTIPSAILKTKDASADLFGTSFHFIENKGQYGDTLAHYGQMGKILYGYEGMNMPVLFTEKGMIVLQRKITGLSHEQEEKLERKGIPEEEIERRRVVTDKTITLEWVGSNTNAKIIPEDRRSAYHTYRMIPEKAYGYSRIVYKDLYPGIDLVYSFSRDDKAGFEYSLLAAPGADLSAVKLKAGGDIKKIKTERDGQLTLSSAIDGISFSIPVNYYGTKPENRSKSDIVSNYTINGNEIGFSFPKDYDHTKPLVIDPFVTGTGTLAGLNAGKAKDVDFDYAGNVYVAGGGDMFSTHSLAKFNAAGALQWTFNGSLTIPAWTFGTYYGGWMVEKSTGNLYLGQGFDPATGFNVIRVTTNGLYDNYITTANPNFMESWKMYWNCNNGSPQILIAGGGINSAINFGVFTPPSTAVSSLNITGIPLTAGGWAQDIADFVFDPVNNDMYTVFGSLFGTPALNNKMYKNTAPYSAASVVWNVPSGYNTVSEAANRPYLAASGLNDNSANMLSVNTSYLYFWDGKNLKAFDKATGNGVGTPVSTANTAFMQGGIIADACNNVFVGDGNGVIKVYQFNGSTFSDAPADIPIPGFAGKAVYDLAYDESRKLLYASGDGFVAAFDVSAYCPTTPYTISVTPNCLTASATATISPAPPAGSVVTYTLSVGGTVITTNTTGIFTGLSPNITYTVLATVNMICNGSQATTTFIMPGPVVTASATSTTCGNNTGTITAAGSVSPGPYSYSIDGVTFQASGTFTGLAAGIYTVTVKDANGCTTQKVLTILNSNGPQLTLTSTNAECGVTNGSITAAVTGGTAPYQYSLNGGAYQGSNFFNGLGGGTYTVTVKDATGCTNAAQVVLSSSPAPQITATPVTASCGNGNGSITAYGSSGTAPLQYSINGNTFQASSTFINLFPGTYTVTVKDANGCTSTVTVTVPNSPAPTVTAVPTSAACNNINGTITTTGNGGIAPLQYSINGSTFQASNIFFGLGAGTYTVTVKDATGCTNTTTVTVGNTNAPTVTAVSTASVCSSNSGTITITATGGVTPYTYSVNGVTFQASNLFTALAPGNYIAYVRDAGGCIATFSITVGTPAGPSITATATQTACNTNTGTITANGTGGAPPLQYSIDGTTYQAGNTFSGLGAGTYTVYVKDANGCTRSTTVLITNVSGLSLTASSIASDCSGSTGTITATATGGAAPLQYSINGTVYQASNIFTGVASGTYTVYVKDASGCIVTKQVTVVAVAGPSLNLSVTMTPSCGAANGVIRATASGGTPPLTYSLDGGAYQSAFFFLNVLPGLHTVTVKDANNCTGSATITLVNSGTGTPPTDVTFVVRDALACTGQTGRIKNLKGVPSGGGNSYVFSLDGGPFTTANQFTNVPVGLHTITAQNQSTGCTVSKLVTIGSGTPATATATATASACGASTGTITISGVGVNTPYHASINGGVSWNTFFPPGANAFTFTGLAPGTYAIIMADDADFTAGTPDIPGACLTTIFVVVPSTGGPSISTTQINPTCADPNGSITATGSGGTAPYTYSINGGAFFASGTFNNLTPGSYAVTVKDASGCITGTSVILSNPAVPVVTATTIATSCNENNGTITASGSGGVAPLQYSLNGTVFQSSNIFSNLAPGTYTVYVHDANNCYSSTTVTIANTPMPRVSAFTIAATCTNNDGSLVASGTGGTTPYTFSINGTVYQSSGTFPALAAGFYTIYMKDARGCIVTTGVTIANTTGPAITNTITQSATCNNPNGSITVTATGGNAPLDYSINGGPFQSSNIFTTLAPGTYTITVRDASGCLANRAVVVANINGPQTLTAAVVDAACGNTNGSITANATGGTGPLQYSINGTTYQSGSLFSNVPAGNYTLYVKDANGCIKTIPVTVADLSAPVLTATSSPASCGSFDGTITAEATGGTQPLTYSINGTVFQVNNVFTGLAASTYTITVKDARGCTNTFNVNVGVIGSVVTPAFTQVGPYCAGAVIPALPTTSNNGITGAWSPAINNTTTTTYTFTPAAGQCANTTTMTITIKPKPIALIIYHN